MMYQLPMIKHLFPKLGCVTIFTLNKDYLILQQVNVLNFLPPHTCTYQKVALELTTTGENATVLGH